MSDRGIVGLRQLLAVQTFDIARLTTHPVEITPGTFVAVSGVGPKGDSNGSGKTSFLAAVSILLADPQWRLDINGGKPARGVLFRPDAAGIDPLMKVTAAPHGYVVAVFAEAATPADTALTVWVKIAAEAPYVQARWVEGIHVADASTDEERALQADDLWRALPAEVTISAKRMAEVLYGDAPRCLTYLDTSLRPRIPSLLSQQMTEMQPPDIGSALIGLAGLTTHLDEEERQRSTVLTQQKKIAKAEFEGKQTWLDEETELAGVESRESARSAIERAEGQWRLYLAKQYLHVLDQDRSAAALLPEREDIHKTAQAITGKAQSDLATLRAATGLADKEEKARLGYIAADERHGILVGARSSLDTRKTLLVEERNKLQPLASRWNGKPLHEAQHDLNDAISARSEAAFAVTSAAGDIETAKAALDRARAGLAGPAGILAEQIVAGGGTAVAFADIIEIDDAARGAWEPRLWPWRNAVVIQTVDLSDDDAILTAQPGTQLIFASSLDDTEKVSVAGLTYPAPLEGFFTALEQRLTFRTSPERVDDDALRASTLGKFTEPFIGRRVHIRRALAVLSEAEQLHEQATARSRVAEAKWTLADAQNTAAHAAARLVEIAELEADLSQKIEALAPQLSAAAAAKTEANEGYQAARSLNSSYANLVSIAASALETARRQESEHLKRLEDLRGLRERLAVEGWRSNWGADEAEAVALLESEQVAHHTRPQTLLRRASELVNEAMNNFLTGRGDTPDDLVDAIRQREYFAEQSTNEPPTVALGTVTAALVSRLYGYADRDFVTRSRIEKGRATREQALQELRIEASDFEQRLVTVQGMIENHIEGVLRNVSLALDRLSTYGAELDIVSRRPEGAAGWRWEITPKWRRSARGGMITYQEVANGAQVKVFAIQLVLAALLADSDTVGRILILDELGNSLGDVNRREVLSNLHVVAERQQITILGTCQDSVLPDAADHLGELLWFTHASTNDAYNQPTRMWGHDKNGSRVELTADWLRIGRAHV